MREYICVGFVDFMLKGNSLLDYTNLFPPNEYKIFSKIFSINKDYFMILKRQ